MRRRQIKFMRQSVSDAELLGLLAVAEDHRVLRGVREVGMRLLDSLEQEGRGAVKPLDKAAALDRMDGVRELLLAVEEARVRGQEQL